MADKRRKRGTKGSISNKKALDIFFDPNGREEDVVGWLEQFQRELRQTAASDERIAVAMLEQFEELCRRHIGHRLGFTLKNPSHRQSIWDKLLQSADCSFLADYLERVKAGHYRLKTEIIQKREREFWQGYTNELIRKYSIENFNNADEAGKEKFIKELERVIDECTDAIEMKEAHIKLQNTQITFPEEDANTHKMQLETARILLPIATIHLRSILRDKIRLMDPEISFLEERLDAINQKLNLSYDSSWSISRGEWYRQRPQLENSKEQIVNAIQKVRNLKSDYQSRLDRLTLKNVSEMKEKESTEPIREREAVPPQVVRAERPRREALEQKNKIIKAGVDKLHQSLSLENPATTKEYSIRVYANLHDDTFANVNRLYYYQPKK